MKKVFYVTLHLADRISFGVLGFTSCVFCNVEAENNAEAEEIAKAHFEGKGKTKVTKMFSRIQQNHCTDVLIKTGHFYKQTTFQK